MGPLKLEKFQEGDIVKYHRNGLELKAKLLNLFKGEKGIVFRLKTMKILSGEPNYCTIVGKTFVDSDSDSRIEAYDQNP